MAEENLPPEFLKRLKAVKKKRPRTVIEHILKQGHITTEELRDIYGYNHPPRAARDVREEGIPLETFRVIGSNGRKIGAYRFGNPDAIEEGKLGGRQVFSRQFKIDLFEWQGGRCGVCQEIYEDRYLQIDHRIPYAVAGDAPPESRDKADYMLLCGSDNRAKSWSCENCENGIRLKDKAICAECYWASPESYTHLAMRTIRRVDIVWLEDEIGIYERLVQLAAHADQPLKEYLKNILKIYAGQDI